jgi:DNA-binding response OmpR family regulator
MPVVLIVENDSSAADAIASALEQQGFAVVRAENQPTHEPTGMPRSGPEHFDSLVLDRLLPELDRLGLLTALRAAGVQTPVLILSDSGTRQSTLQVGDLVVDLLKRTVRRAQRSIELATREYDLLVWLMQHAGHVVNRATLFEVVWRYRPGEHSTNVIDVHIARLRRKVDARGETPMIFTVRGAGYVLKGPT